MIRYISIAAFRARLTTLLEVRRGVYAGVRQELVREFQAKTIEQIRQNYDMILMESDQIVIKLRLPDKKQRLSKKDGYRLIYMVSKVDDLVVFLDIYPKNGPLQQLDIDRDSVKALIIDYISEAQDGTLEPFEM